MISKILITGALALSISACASITPANITAEIATVQADVQQLCGVVPATLDVASLISGGNAILGGASAIATAICDSVAVAPVAPATAGKRGASHAVVVNGVVVHYQ